MNTTLIKGLLLASVLGTSLTVSPVFAAEGTPKTPTCKDEAKAAGITDKAELKKFMEECKAKHKAEKK